MKCLLCQADQHQSFTKVESFGIPLTYYQCAHCGLIFQSPEESQAGDPQFYAETYRKVYQSSAEPTAKDLWVQEHRAMSLVKILQMVQLDPPEHILDIGASSGLLLETLRNTFGGDGVGVEPGDAYRAHAQSRGITMYPSLDDLMANSPVKFDLISLIHVLEHMADPVDVLKMIRTDLLRESGVLLLEVPNFYAHDSYELAHLACYTPHTLQEVLRQAGFHVFFFHRHGFPLSSMLNLYLTIMAQPLPPHVCLPPIKRDRMVGLKRKAGLFYRRIVQKLFPHRAWLYLPGARN
jgi:SAM-dependent methyltransferase